MILNKSLKLFMLGMVAYVAVLNVSAAKQNWFNFKTTLGKFYDHPRTVEEAIAKGWTQVSNDCSQGAKFPGNRYAIPHDGRPGPEILIIYDVNGFIAGMHSVVSERFTDNDKYVPFGNGNPWFRPAVLNGDDVYLATAYFVDPDLICGSGRTQDQFDTQGTGDRLLFQTGPTLTVAPMTAEEAKKEGVFFEHNCIPHMGQHWLSTDPSVDPNVDQCNPSDPIQYMYTEGKLSGFVWFYYAKLGGKAYENAGVDGIKAVLKNPPKCMLDYAEKPGAYSLHVYLTSHMIKCQDNGVGVVDNK